MRDIVITLNNGALADGAAGEIVGLAVYIVLMALVILIFKDALERWL